MNRTSEYALTIVVPVFNEEDNIHNLGKAMSEFIPASKVKTCVQIGGIIVIYLHYIIFGALASQPNTSFSAIFAIRTDGADLILTIVGWVVTLVTIYSGYDYLRKNWDLIKDGAVKAK